MATLTVQDISLTGQIVNDDLAAADVGGDVFANTGTEMFVVNNASGGAVAVTFTAQGTTVQKDGFGTVAVSNTIVSVDAADETIVGPFPTARFNNTSGQVEVTYDSVTSVTVVPYRLTAAK